MAEERQIILIPKERYWEWVQAVRDYVVHFGLTMTPDRDAAGRFYGEDHLVTVIDFPGAWPEDIAAWFKREYSGVRLDIIRVQHPETLEELLAERIDQDDRYGDTRPDFQLIWPTNYGVITQPFGVNAHIYRRYGLPGHEGVDIRAPYNSPIYAGAGGKVYLVHDGRRNHAYGIHVRIQHSGGYKTIYAHMSRALVKEGERVEAGQRIGLADSTGNSSGSHLHITLKKEGATERGETRFPSDIIDPTPYLRMPGEDGGEAGPEAPAWAPGKCLIGVHGRADGPLEDADFPPLEEARVEAVKFLASAQPENVDRCRSINPNTFFVARLFADFRHDRVVRGRRVCRVAAPRHGAPVRPWGALFRGAQRA